MTALFLSKPVELTCIKDGLGGIAGLDLLTEATFSDAKEITEIMTGNSNFPIVFSGGKRDVILTVTSMDFEKFDLLSVGDIYTDVALECQGYTCGSADGSTITITLSQAMVLSKSEVSFSAEGNTPASYTAEFKLIAKCGDIAEPTYTVATT